MQEHTRDAIVLVLSAILCACQGTGAPTTRAVPTYSAEVFSQTISVRGSSFSADGSEILMTSNQDGIFNVYSLPFGGGEAEQLTHSTSSATSGISWFPGDDRFLFTADQEGNELNHVYMGRPGEKAVDLTPGDQLKAQFFAWAENGEAFLLLSNERDASAFDIYRYQVTGPVEAASGGVKTLPGKILFTNTAGYMPSLASRDLRYLVLSKVRSNKDDDLYLWDTNAPDRDPQHITPHAGDVSFSASSFSPDGEFLYYGCDQDSEFQRIWSYEIATGKRQVIEERGWDILGMSFTRDERYRVLAINVDARTQLEVLDLSTGKNISLPDFGRREVRSFQTSKDGRRVILSVAGDTSPSDLYVGRAGDSEFKALTRSLPAAIDPANLVAAEVVRYASFDGLQIPAILYRPQQASASDRVPGIIWVHGGPGGQSRTGYRATVQYLVNHGYAILMVNNRGSSGYGKTFYHLDDRRHGEDDLQDCVFGRRYLESLDWIDGSRIGIMGGSYGGFMVAAALTFEPEAFDVGIDIFGVTNWVRTLENIPAWWGANRDSLFAELGDPREDGERLRRISPLFHAENIVRPLLVVQGANDPRVLKVESDELVAAARKNGVPVQYIVFDDEGHGFRNKQNQIVANRAYLKFLEEHLR